MGEETVGTILNFMNDGANRIKPSPSKNIILVMGDSGTGKSTLTRFLASDDDYLVAVKVGGSGYTIVDPSNPKAICESAFESCTVIPELVVDQVHNKTYYDCPGFRDTRSVAHDISTSYFIRKVIDEAESIKIIFTLSFNSVRKGGSRHDFSKLVENVFNMFKDIRKYEESVCLVVNKVENVYEEVDGQLRIVPDETMLQDVIEFLNEAKNPQVKSLLSENTTELINILINDKDPKSPRIGIFRRPNKAGPLNQMKAFQDGRDALKKMIYDQLKYTVRDVNDFGNTIEPNSKLRLRDVEMDINKSLLDDASMIGQQLIEYFNEKEEVSNDIDELVQELMKGLEKSINLKHELSNGTVNARLFVQELIIFLDDVNCSISEEKRLQLSYYCDNLEFIETVIGTTKHQSDQWQSSLSKVWSYLEGSLNWYSFLIDLRVTLSEYSVQHDVDEFTTLVEKFRSDIISELTQEDVVTFLKQLLPKVNDITGRQYEIPNIDEINNTKAKFLLDLMDVEFKPMSTECHGKRLVVKGYNIKMADVVKVMDLCDESEVEIFALNKMFVDADFVKKEGQLTIIVPELEVINNRKIVLDGEDAPDHTIKAVTTDTSPGSDGSDGLPGLPGGSAGELASAVQNCKNCDSLTVSAVGGRGGKGQDGGDGLQGSDGKPAMQMDHVSNTDVWMEEWRGEGFNPYCDIVSSRQRRAAFLPFLITFLAGAAIAGGSVAASKSSRSSSSSSDNAMKRFKCYVNGLLGKSGGNGGDGGVGGEGGNEGRVSFVYAKSTPTDEGPKITVEKGPRGAQGVGGNGAMGGLQGDTLIQERYEDSGNTSSYYTPTYYRAENGKPGVSNSTDTGLIHPKSAMTPLDFSHSIASYENYLQLNSENAIMNSIWESFLAFFKVDGKTRRSLSSHHSTPGTPTEDRRFFSVDTNHLDENFTAQIAPYNAAGPNGHLAPGHLVDFNAMTVQSNLMLMDVIIRKIKGETRKPTIGMMMDETNDSHAHFLAYNAHIPENFTIPE